MSILFILFSLWLGLLIIYTNFVIAISYKLSIRHLKNKLKIKQISIFTTMKAIRLLLAMLAMTSALTSCDSDQIITPEQLPETAKVYIKQNYPDAQIMIVKKEKKLFKTKYEVKLDNFMDLDFDEDGMLTDMDMDD